VAGVGKETATVPIGVGPGEASALQDGVSHRAAKGVRAVNGRLANQPQGGASGAIGGVAAREVRRYQREGKPPDQARVDHVPIEPPPPLWRPRGWPTNRSTPRPAPTWNSTRGVLGVSQA
jgi:hypothetical protein